MARRLNDENGQYLPPDLPFPEPSSPPIPPPAPAPGISQRLIDITESQFRWSQALDFWQIANEELAAQRFGNAEIAYEESQKAAIRYFEKFYTSSSLHLAFNVDSDAST